MQNFKGVFLIRIECVRGVLLLYEVSSPSEFPMSCRLLVRAVSIACNDFTETGEMLKYIIAYSFRKAFRSGTKLSYVMHHMMFVCYALKYLIIYCITDN